MKQISSKSLTHLKLFARGIPYCKFREKTQIMVATHGGISNQPIGEMYQVHHDLIQFQRNSHSPISMSRRVPRRSNIAILGPSKDITLKCMASKKPDNPSCVEPMSSCDTPSSATVHRRFCYRYEMLRSSQHQLLPLLPPVESHSPCVMKYKHDNGKGK